MTETEDTHDIRHGQEHFFMDFSEKIKEIRKTEGYTQKKFAELIDVSEDSIRNYENNRRIPTGDVLKNICQQFPEYALWLMTDQVQPEAGNISPAIRRDEKESGTGTNG